MKAVIMAAGQGERLKPLTNTRPKVMLQVAGKPIIWHLIMEAKKAGVTEAVVIVKYMAKMVIEYFKKNDPGIKLKFIEQGDKYGTAEAILTAKDEIKDTFLVLAGDTITEASIIKQVIGAHKTGKMTLALKKVKNSKRYGVIEIDSSNRIISIQEKPEKPKSDLINISIYCMDPTLFSEMKTVKKSERGEYEITDLLMGAKAVIADGFWLDIGHPWDLLKANEYLLEKMDAKTGPIENSTINGKVIMEEGAKIIHSYIEGNVYIGKNTVIGPNAFIRGDTSIGENCSIGSGTTIKNSILFDKVNAKHLSYIGDSIIGEDVNFGSGTQVANYRFDEGNVNVLTEKGWANSGTKKLGCFVGDNTKFGVLACIMPGKLIGNDCWIGSGVEVNRNIAPHTKVFQKQELFFGKNED
ncbi:MAG: bifunctional sugar-1-phosphate nucleotidylyltransferase/acetyltransferase [Candidatus Micrarchaeota archaeon]